MEIVRATAELLASHAGDIIRAGLVPGLVAAVVVGVIGGLLVRRARRTFGARRRAGTIWLVVSLFAAIGAIASAAALPSQVSRATAIVAERSASLKLHAATGMLLLAPLVDAYTQEGQDGQAIDDMHGPDGVDLAVLTHSAVQTDLLVRLTDEQVSRSAKAIRRELRVPKTAIPPRLIRYTLDTAQKAFVASPDIFPDLLGALNVDEEGTLGVKVAARQVGNRFFEKHATTVALRGLGWTHWWVAFFGALPFLLTIGVVEVRNRRRADRPTG